MTAGRPWFLGTKRGARNARAPRGSSRESVLLRFLLVVLGGSARRCLLVARSLLRLLLGRRRGGGLVLVIGLLLVVLGIGGRRGERHEGQSSNQVREFHVLSFGGWGREAAPAPCGIGSSRRARGL